MAATINIPVYSDVLVVLGTAGIVVPIVHRFGVSPVLAYLAAGALLGPLGLGSLIPHVPVLYWLTVVDAENVAGIADLGVVFLLFAIGLELSYERLVAMRRLVFGMGSLQMVLTTAALAGIAVAAGQSPPVAIVIGCCLALSSTAIVLEVLSNQGRLTASVGRASFAVLLAQDLAVIPILMFISILGADREGSVLASIGVALLQAATAVAIIIVVGRLLLRPLFRLVAGTKSSELFIAAILFVIVATGVLAAVAGLSMALGAFVAGLLLAETEYRKAIQATIEPFKGLLLGIFFFTVGMNIDARELAREPLWILASVASLIAIKAILVIGIARYFNLTWPAAIETGLLLGPGGEFAFVGVGLARALDVISAPAASFLLATTSLTMLLIPLLAMTGRQLGKSLEPKALASTALLDPPVPRQKHAIVVGHGRVGKVVCELLRAHNVPYTASDHNALVVTEDRRRGHTVYFGEATDPAFLKACGLMEAAGIIVTIHTSLLIDEIVTQVRALRPDVIIISRARDAEHARHLYSIGVTDAVPETIEASLQLSEAALVGLGVPTGPVIASIHEQREVLRRALQSAAQAHGAGKTRAIRTKARR